jgi:hypothetical protein
MKKSLLAAAAFGAVALGASTFAAREARAGDDDVAAIILSASFPGAGEWYNAGFSGGFPLVECIVGNICPCVHVASIIDAAAGKTDDGMRFDFWASPN